jgi:hypothetical protein
MDAGKVWKSLVAGLCGSAAHGGLMFLKGWMGWLPTFQPYRDVQHALGELLGNPVHPVVPWALSFINGTLIIGLLFATSYRLLPGHSGAAKGFVLGIIGWIAMGLIFFPLLGRGLFASEAGLGLLPAAFSLAMVLTYSVFVGLTYSALHLQPRRHRENAPSRSR